MIFTFACLFLMLPMLVGGFSFSCPPEEILGFVSANPNEIDMNAVPVTICGEKRTCIYTRGAPCLAKGQYAAGVDEDNGNVIHGCCQISAPVEKHQGDDCHEYIIESTDTMRITAGPRPLPPSKNHQKPPGWGGQGKGSSPPAEKVIMVTKNLPPGTPNQYVKSITKLTSDPTRGYTVTICTPQCGRSTTTRKPTTQKPRSHEKQQQQQQEQEQQNDAQQQQQQQENQQAPKKKGILGSGHHCFSSDMTVTTPAGIKRMDQIRAGDQVLVISSDSKQVFEPIEWLYHRDPDAEVDFISVTTKSNRVLRLSANHLIPFVPCSNEELHSRGLDYFANTQSFFARRLKVGTCIASLINEEMVADQVVAIKKERKRGIYSPITSQGTMVVNDVYVSCYSSVENHVAQRSVHSALIAVRHAVSRMWNSENEDSNVPLPLKVLLKMAQLVIPSNVFGGY